MLHGGLGNQLFQYAVGRALSIRTGTDLKLERSRLSPDAPTASTPRQLQLRAFRIRGELVSRPARTDKLLKARFKLFDLLRPISVPLAAQVCRVHKDQDAQRFAPEVLELPGHSLLYGYYQSERYFADVRSALRRDLVPRSALPDATRAWRDRIDATNAVAVHVRRGDYVEQGWALPPTYYRAAINTVRSLRGEVELFFFSDDIPWVRENSDSLLPDAPSAPTVHYVDCNDGTAVANDLALMKSCRHQIIANSTLSWWGAWLNRHDEKIVLAPAYWIRDPVDETDIIPERWGVVDWRSSPTAPPQNSPML